MATNCVPGDLAVVVKSDFHENIGAFVIVNRSVPLDEEMILAWDVTPLAPERLVSFDMRSGKVVRGCLVGPFAIHDRCLRPIRPPGLAAYPQRRHVEVT